MVTTVTERVVAGSMAVLSERLRTCFFPLIVSVRSFMNPVLPQLDLLKCRKESMSYKNEVRI